VREKYCSLAEKVRLISQANMTSVVEARAGAMLDKPKYVFGLGTTRDG